MGGAPFGLWLFALLTLLGCQEPARPSVVDKVRLGVAPGTCDNGPDPCTITPKEGRWIMLLTTVKEQIEAGSEAKIRVGGRRIKCFTLTSKETEKDISWGGTAHDFRMAIARLTAQQRFISKGLAPPTLVPSGLDDPSLVNSVFGSLSQEMREATMPPSLRRLAMRPYNQVYSEKMWWEPEPDGAYKIKVEPVSWSLVHTGDEMTGFQKLMWTSNGKEQYVYDAVYNKFVGEGAWDPSGGDCPMAQVLEPRSAVISDKGWAADLAEAKQRVVDADASGVKGADLAQVNAAYVAAQVGPAFSVIAGVGPPVRSAAERMRDAERSEERGENLVFKAASFTGGNEELTQLVAEELAKEHGKAPTLYLMAIDKAADDSEPTAQAAQRGLAPLEKELAALEAEAGAAKLGSEQDLAEPALPETEAAKGSEEAAADLQSSKVELAVAQDGQATPFVTDFAVARAATPF